MTTDIVWYNMDPGAAREKLTAFNGRRILAQGDSWFSIFFPFNPGNLLNYVATTKGSLICSMAYPGILLQDMTEGRRLSEFYSLIAAPNFAFHFDLILLSGGGNDLVQALGDMLVVPNSPSPSQPERYVDANRLDAFIARVETYFGMLFAVVNSTTLNQGTPILINTYDRATPRNLGTLGRGPWFWPTLQAKGITDSKVQMGIVDLVLGRFDQCLESLGQQYPNQVYSSELLGTLARAAPGDLKPKGDWHDEIHASARGWKKLGTKLSARIDQFL